MNETIKYAIISKNSYLDKNAYGEHLDDLARVHGKFKHIVVRVPLNRPEAVILEIHLAECDE